MSEFDDLNLINDAFSDLRAETAPFVKPAGARQAHATVRHQRKVRTIVAGVVTVLAIAIPVAAFATVNRTDAPPTPGSTASVSPEPSATAAPSPSPTPTPATTVPDGRISLADLGNATLDLPVTGNGLCPAMKLAFRNGKATFDGGESLGPDVKYELVKVVHSDVDHDGAEETAALFACRIPGSSFQVVAFDRDAGGAIVTVGQVLASTLDYKVPNIFDIGADTEGNIQVQVGDFVVCCANLEHKTEPQWRTYGLRDGKFAQVGGPTSFPENSRYVDLDVSASPLAFGKPDAVGTRHGRLTLTVRNQGTFDAPAVGVFLRLPKGLKEAGTGWDDCGLTADLVNQELQGTNKGSCLFPGVRAGGTSTIVFEFTISGPVDAANPQSGFNVRTVMPSGVTLAEVSNKNNFGPLTITLG
ncbi:hypothetical protein R8Z50_00780 [Longispora sp. K20-0274]|uniref:hypothetical protein n=1 Tax=Longispora sp. K20-0274 TaxID=3088255 RepID=UPI00399A9DE6